MGFFSKLFGGKSEPDRPGLGPDELARRLNLTPEALAAVAVSYRQVEIKKRHGGLRTLHVPADPLKTLQRTLLRRLLGRLSAHPAAVGYERGQSIVTNAVPHVGKTVLLKMDIKDFFPATTAARVTAYFRTIGWNAQAAKILTHLCTYKGGLPQGAPTSPRLCNLVNVPLDARLAALAAKTGAAYTRYADDITFSFDDATGQAHRFDPKTQATEWVPANPADQRSRVAMLIRCTKAILDDYDYHLHQKSKLQIRRRYERQQVTGLVVNERVNLPRTRRRLLRAVAHHLKTGKPATLSLQQYAGWLNLEAMILAQRDPPPPPAAPTPTISN